MTSGYSGKKFPSGALFLFISLLPVAFALFLTGCGGSASAPLSAEASLSAPEQAHLQALRAELAASKSFYIELSLRDKELRLCHSGAFLRKYKIDEAGVQTRTLLFMGRKHPKDWNSRIWREGRFNPPHVVERVRIIPGDESTRPTPGKPGILPPTLEELIPVPPSFTLDFPQGFSLMFELRGEIPGKAAAPEKKSPAWNDFLVGLGMRRGPAARLRLKMDAKEGSAFFRSCPPGSPLLIMP